MTMATRSRGVVAAFFVVCAASAAPSLALACPVCMDPREANQAAFISMTIFMSLLPLGAFGALVLWIRKRVRDAEARSVDSPSESSPGA